MLGPATILVPFMEIQYPPEPATCPWLIITGFFSRHLAIAAATTSEAMGSPPGESTRKTTALTSGRFRNFRKTCSRYRARMPSSMAQIPSPYTTAITGRVSQPRGLAATSSTMEAGKYCNPSSTCCFTHSSTADQRTSVSTSPRVWASRASTSALSFTMASNCAGDKSRPLLTSERIRAYQSSR